MKHTTKLIRVIFLGLILTALSSTSSADRFEYDHDYHHEENIRAEAVIDPVYDEYSIIEPIYHEIEEAELAAVIDPVYILVQDTGELKRLESRQVYVAMPRDVDPLSVIDPVYDLGMGLSAFAVIDPVYVKGSDGSWFEVIDPVYVVAGRDQKISIIEPIY